MTCNISGCDRTGKLTRGMCGKHYRYWIDHTPAAERGPAPRFARQFWDYVDKSGDCWLWTGPTNVGGYGWWSGNGQRGLAHRLSLTAASGCPDESLLACHHCDTPACVNPAHLYWGTAKQNAADVMERGRIVNQNIDKTHCKRGHPLAGDNLQIVGTEQKRQCRTCGNERSRVRMAARRARHANAI